jgi:hypothetical protein
MDSYLLVHRRTGMPLRGYRVGAADQIEISHANQRLQACGSDLRFVNALHTGHTPITPEDAAATS